MNGEFVVLMEGKLHTFTKYEEIPKTFDNLIKFIPKIPEPPHTHEQHEEINSWHNKFKELMTRETNGNHINN